jgi:Ser/Thr protein kinase RdoA (MazF antagonist)
VIDREPPDLSAWSKRAEIEGRLGGGDRNAVWLVRLDSDRAVARVSRRSTQALEWEVELLSTLAQHSFRVSQPIQTMDGRLIDTSVLLMTWMEGTPPSSGHEWRAVADELRRMHELTRGWRQRPDFASSQDLLHHNSGGDVHLDHMPTDVVERVRSAWTGVADEPTSVIHADARGNTLVENGRVGFIDWDESRVDAWLLDFDLPLSSIDGVDKDRLVAARRAGVAWEVACSWTIEPEYARRRLRELETLSR